MPTGAIRFPCLLACVVAAASCDSTGVRVEPFSATLDGLPFATDTAAAQVFASDCDSTIIVSASRHVANTAEGISIVLSGFRSSGQFVMGDSLSGAFGQFSVVDLPQTPSSAVHQFHTTTAGGGTLHLTTVDWANGNVGGAFSFPVTDSSGPPRQLAGQFHLHFRVQQVYVVSCSS